MSYGVFAAGYDPQSFPGYAALPERAKPLFERLARSEFSDTGALELAKIPEAEQATFEVMQRLVRDPDNDVEFLHYVTRVLRLRDDLSSEHKRWVRDTLRSKPGRTSNAMDFIFKMYGAYLLEKYPSAENEELMIEYLRDKKMENVVPGALDVGNSSSYMDVLGRFVGTNRAIEPLREYAKHFRPETWDYKDVMSAIEQIEVREKQRETQAATGKSSLKSSLPAPGQSGKKLSSHPEASTSAPVYEETSDRWKWLVAMAACLLAAIGLSLKQRKR